MYWYHRNTGETPNPFGIKKDILNMTSELSLEWERVSQVGGERMGMFWAEGTAVWPEVKSGSSMMCMRNYESLGVAEHKAGDRE